MKNWAFRLLVIIRNSFLRKNIVKCLARLHNFSYQWLGFFAIEKNGIHPKHRLMNYYQFFLDNVSVQNRVLDIGCGNGALTFAVAKKARKVIGIDFNQKNIDFAKKNFCSPDPDLVSPKAGEVGVRDLSERPYSRAVVKDNLEFIYGNVLKYLPNEKIDVIILSNVLEHIKNRISFLRKLKQKFQAKFLIRVPMINRDWLTLYKKELGLEWRLDKTHYIEYTLETFRQEIEQAGLKIEKYSVQFGEIWAVVRLSL